jgi:site-specific recombinase XerD
MRLRPELARALLPQVDPGRMRGDIPVGLRDGALLALLAAGLTAVEVARLKATRVRQVGRRLIVTVARHGVAWHVVLPTPFGAPLLAWLSESRLWAEDRLIFPGPRGPLSRIGICKVVTRYVEEAGWSQP